MARQPVTAPVADTVPAADAAPVAPTAPEPIAPAEAPTAPAAEDGEMVEARALLAFDDFDVDAIVTASPAAIAALEVDGKVDPHPDAVAYAKSLQG